MHTETLAPAGTEVRANKISLNTLAEMTGFPAELIQQELFSSQETAENEGVSLEELRKAMLSYIDSAMLINE
jgi:hypothetical protein